MITVRIIRIFEGPRHDLLRSIWECIAEYCQEKMVLKWFENSERSEALTLEANREIERLIAEDWENRCSRQVETIRKTLQERDEWKAKHLKVRSAVAACFEDTR